VTVHPPIPKECTRAFYNACDICLVPLAPFPILQETVPSKIFEVMACERPAVGCLGGEGRAIIERSGAGVAVAPGRPEELLGGIEALLRKSPEERIAMGRRGRSFVDEHYGREVLARRYLERLRGLVGTVSPANHLQPTES
jgi:glycosyltransferase involved in cell wall biosynthesis